ncbi:L-threonylcarbamoyladenylate synthase [Geomicrobium halophilum]|uniref:Threonylcarbamoyl-AMP synthase n=1 Tax=Geomicrobium halophilum TaxID=549000 RepID=A0A841Q068_9BACL|nr:L-threonylcarbamoyladenylate synthase [Geomicrobium halophilum]
MNYQQTEHWVVDKLVDVHNDQECIEKAAKLLRTEELVAFPTETVYGLGANGLSTCAVQKIFEAKGRPSDNPLILHIGSFEQLDALVTKRSSIADQLIEQYWPGPLTLIFPVSKQVPATVTGGLDTVAIRMPGHDLARAIISASAVPVAAPSANRSGRPSPTRAEHVKEDLDGRVAAIIDGGPTGYGLESTVVDVSGERPVILRPGGVTEEDLQKTLGISIASESVEKGKESVRAPGMKYRHYAPKTQLLLVEGSVDIMQKRIAEAQKQGKRVAAAVTSERESLITAEEILILGSAGDLDSISSRLYAILRDVDKLDVDILFVQTFVEAGLGKAIMNRLRKAADDS